MVFAGMASAKSTLLALPPPVFAMRVRYWIGAPGSTFPAPLGVKMSTFEAAMAGVLPLVVK